MSTVLINPFERWSEGRLLLLGSLGLVLGSAMGFWFHVRWDGVIDMHAVSHLLWWQPWVDNLINVAALSTTLYLSGLWINRKTRFIDMLGAVLVARLVMYLLALANSTSFLSRVGQQVMESMANGQSPSLSGFPLAGIVALAAFVVGIMVWHFALLYQGFRVASNARGSRAVAAFIASIVVAEILSKLVLMLWP